MEAAAGALDAAGVDVLVDVVLLDDEADESLDDVLELSLLEVEDELDELDDLPRLSVL